MSGEIKALRPTLESLARSTWSDIADGRRLGVGMGETGITDRNMLVLRREHPSLLVHKFPVNEEVRTGADWEWWLGGRGGWMCLVFQAKVLDSNLRYAGITKGQREGKPQVDTLLRSCLQRSERFAGAVWPLYCFYNSWRGPWPRGVKQFPDRGRHSSAATDLQLYGCAVADAWSVRRVLVHRDYANRRTLRDSYLPLSRPWSTIFPDQDPFAGSWEGISHELSSWVHREDQLSLRSPDEVGLSGSSGRRTRRDRSAIYRDPVLIRRPPEYVLDLLEGQSRPRRLKPLGRRVAILVDSE